MLLPDEPDIFYSLLCKKKETMTSGGGHAAGVCRARPSLQGAAQMDGHTEQGTCVTWGGWGRPVSSLMASISVKCRYSFNPVSQVLMQFLPKSWLF